MPQKKKGGSTKKKGKSNSASGAKKKQAGPPRPLQPHDTPTTTTFDPQTPLPDWLRGTPPRKLTRSHVRRYKQATDAFRRELEHLCPIVSAHRGVQAIVDAVHYIQSEDLLVTSSLLTNVTVALRDRTMVDRAFGEDSDVGHRYITKMLVMFSWR